MPESVNRLGASSSLPTCVIRALGRAVDCNMDTSSPLRRRSVYQRAQETMIGAKVTQSSATR
jgi:hypothetical protein